MDTKPHEEDVFKLCDIIRQTSFDIHSYLRHGHREQIYENALVHRLRKKGIAVEQQQELRVFRRRRNLAWLPKNRFADRKPIDLRD